MIFFRFSAAFGVLAQKQVNVVQNKYWYILPCLSTYFGRFLWKKRCYLYVFFNLLSIMLHCDSRRLRILYIFCFFSPGRSFIYHKCVPGWGWIIKCRRAFVIRRGRKNVCVLGAMAPKIFARGDIIQVVTLYIRYGPFRRAGGFFIYYPTSLGDWWPIYWFIGVFPGICRVWHRNFLLYGANIVHIARF